MLRLPRFRFLVPKTLDDAVSAIADGGPDAAVVAGGTDLYPNMKRRHQEPRTLIALRRIRELRGIEGDPKSGLRIGGAATLTQIADDPRVESAYPFLSRTLRQVATPLIQNMGTIGGNLCLDTRCTYYNQNYEWRKAISFCMKKDGDTCWVAPGSPRCWAVSSSDSAPVMVAIGARLRFVSKQGERVIAAEELYRDDGIQYLTKRPDEVLAEVLLPPVNGWSATYWKLRRRGSFDFPVLGVAAWAKWGKDGVVEDIRVVLGAVASYPIEERGVAGLLRGKKLTEDLILEAAETAQKPAKPLNNTDFVANWRKQVAQVYVARALRELAALLEPRA